MDYENLIKAGYASCSTTRICNHKKAGIALSISSIYLGKLAYNAQIFLLVDSKKLRCIVSIAGCMTQGSFVVKIIFYSTVNLVYT